MSPSLSSLASRFFGSIARKLSFFKFSDTSELKLVERRTLTPFSASSSPHTPESDKTRRSCSGTRFMQPAPPKLTSTLPLPRQSPPLLPPIHPATHVDHDARRRSGSLDDGVRQRD